MKIEKRKTIMDKRIEKALNIIEQLSDESKINSGEYKDMLDALMLSFKPKVPETLEWSDPLLAPFVEAEAQARTATSSRSAYMLGVTDVARLNASAVAHIFNTAPVPAYRPSAPAPAMMSSSHVTVRANPKPFTMYGSNGKIVLFHDVKMGGFSSPERFETEPDTIYHYRSYANARYGWTKSDEITDTTGRRYPIEGPVGGRLLTNAGIDKQLVSNYLSSPEEIPYESAQSATAPSATAPSAPALKIKAKLRSKVHA
jgi:hypothetical protein